MVIPLICFIYRRVYGGVSTITKKRFCNAGKKEYAVLWIGGITMYFFLPVLHIFYIFSFKEKVLKR